MALPKHFIMIHYIKLHYNINTNTKVVIHTFISLITMKNSRKLETNNFHSGYTKRRSEMRLALRRLHTLLLYRVHRLGPLLIKFVYFIWFNTYKLFCFPQRF